MPGARAADNLRGNTRTGPTGPNRS